jgi:hypothetical protein
VRRNTRAIRKENQAMSESDHQIKYSEVAVERQEGWRPSVKKGAPGESRAQLLKQIDAAEKLLEAIKTYKRASDRTAY